MKLVKKGEDAMKNTSKINKGFKLIQHIWIISLLFVLSTGLALAESFTFTPIDVPVPGAASTGALGINNNGQIVGVYTFSCCIEFGFLLSGGSFIPIDFPGAFLTRPIGINNTGQIDRKSVV